jgi:hypothetical protein
MFIHLFFFVTPQDTYLDRNSRFTSSAQPNESLFHWRHSKGFWQDSAFVWMGAEVGRLWDAGEGG